MIDGEPGWLADAERHRPCWLCCWYDGGGDRSRSLSRSCPPYEYEFEVEFESAYPELFDVEFSESADDDVENWCWSGEGDTGAWYEKLEEPVRTEEGEAGMAAVRDCCCWVVLLGVDDRFMCFPRLLLLSRSRSESGVGWRSGA